MNRWVLVCVAALAGCGGKKQEREAPAGTPTAPAETPAAKPAAPAAPTPAEANRVEVTKLLEGWVAAQNAHDFDRYLAHYQKQYFKGVRRTSNRKAVTMDFDGWKKDRARMFKAAGMTVAAEDLAIRSWLDAGSKLKPNTTEVVFTQRFKAGKYADHGAKLIKLWRDPRGRQRIIYEDMLNSEDGWERAAGAAVQVGSWAVPADRNAAIAKWRELAVTGANYTDVLAAMPVDPAVEKVMAAALIAGGNFECKAVLAYGPCGMEADEMEVVTGDATLEWGQFEDKWGFDHPCLRRRLAEWALPRLQNDQLAALAPQLEQMVALDRPEQELVEGALAVTADAGGDLHLAMLAAAVKAGRASEADDAVTGLDEARLVTAAETHRLPSAALALDPTKHVELLARLLADESYGKRGELLERLAAVKHPAVTTALRKVAGESDDCELAMAAAEALADRGDATMIPKHESTAVALARALCMSQYDGDATRALALSKSVVDPKKGLIQSEEVLHDNYEDYEDELGDGEDGDDEEEEDADPEPVQRAAIKDVLGVTHDTTAPSCDGDECTSGERDNGAARELTFGKGSDGKLYLLRINDFRDASCGC